MNWELVLLQGCKGQLLTRRRQASASLPLCAGHIFVLYDGPNHVQRAASFTSNSQHKKNASLWIGLLPSEMLVWTEESLIEFVCQMHCLRMLQYFSTSAILYGKVPYDCTFIVLGLNMVIKSWGTMTFVRLDTTCLYALQSCVLWARADLRISKRCGTCPSHRKGMADGIAHGNAKHSWGCLSLKCLDFINWIISSTPANYHPAVFDDKMKCIEMLTSSFCIICILASSLHIHKQSRSAVKTFQISTLSQV